MALKEHRPTFVTLPEDSPLTRPIIQRDKNIPVDPAKCDRTTFFSGAFWSEAKKRLEITAPYLQYLSSHPIPLEIKTAGRCFKSKLFHHSKVSFASIKLPNYRPGMPISCALPNQGLEFNLPDPRNTLPPVPLTLVTLQKDNPLEWIIDWTRYHLAIGVDRLMIFDNGSAQISDIRHVLKQIEGDIHLIHWPMKFGDYRHSMTTLAQISAVQYAMQFSPDSTWLSNMDIDEYIVPPSTGLKACFPRNILVGGLKMPNFRVLNTSGPHDLARAKNACWRQTVAVTKNTKHWMRLGAKPDPGIHIARYKWPYHLKRLKPETLCFFHYRGLNTAWKETNRARLQKEIPDPERHTEDTRVSAIFERLEKTKK